MLNKVRALWQDEEGLTSVEYALLLALIAVVGIAAWKTLGQTVSSTVTNANTGILNAS